MSIHIILTAKLLPETPSNNIHSGNYKIPHKHLEKLDRYNRCIDTAIDYCTRHNISTNIVYCDNYKQSNDIFISRGKDQYIGLWTKKGTQTFFVPDDAYSKYKYSGELHALHNVLTMSCIHDDDMVIKQVGRLCACDDSFYKRIIKATHEGKEAVVFMYDKDRRCKDNNVCFHGIIAMKKKYWMSLHITNDMPLSSYEYGRHIAMFIQENISGDQIEFVDNVSLECSPSHNPDDLFYI